MGNRVYPAGSLAAYFPWRALEWHPTRNALRPVQVSRASAREVVWRCELGHEWSAAVYQRTLSGSGCPDCYRLEAAERSKAGKQRAREAREQAARWLTLFPPRYNRVRSNPLSRAGGETLAVSGLAGTRGVAPARPTFRSVPGNMLGNVAGSMPAAVELDIGGRRPHPRRGRGW